MVDVSSQSNKVNITVSSSGVSSNVNASGDTSHYYSEKAREWAISNRIVDGVDYSSKYYAGRANQSALNAQSFAQSAQDSYNNFQQSVDGALSNIDSSVQGAIDEINNTKTDIITDIEFVADGEKKEIEELIDSGKDEIQELTNEIKDNAEDIINRVGISMFDTILKDHVLTYEESKGLALQGTYVYKDAIAGSRYGYADFYNKVVEEFENSSSEKKYIKSNVNPIGNVTDNKGVLSGFSASNYVTLPNHFLKAVANADTWEAEFRFTTGSSVTSPERQIIFHSGVSSSTSGVGGFLIDIYQGKIRIAYDTNNSSGVTTQITASTYTEYFTKATFDYSTLTFSSYYKLNENDDWTLIDSLVVNGRLAESASWNTTEMGNSSGNTGYYLNGGSIDLNYCFIDINGERWWNGIDTYNLYKNSNGHLFYDISDKDKVDEFFNTYGMAWFYGIDTENERIFLPRSNYFDQLTGDISEVGKSVEAGLPNIVGHFWGGKSGGDTSGPFTKSNGSNSYDGGGTTDMYKMSFNASLANSIYGNSDTVQPPAVKKLLYICVGNTEATSTVTDVVDVTTTENDTMPLFTPMYFDFAPNNLSWLKAGQQANSGDIYTTCYNELVNVLNGETKYGSLKVVDTANMTTGVDYSEYWKVNQTEMSFVTPTSAGLANQLKDKARILVAKKEITSDDQSWYNLYSDGWLEQGSVYSGGGTSAIVGFVEPFAKTPNVIVSDTSPSTISTDTEGYDYVTGGTDITTTGFRLSIPNGREITWEARGYAEIPTISDYTEDVNLYFKVANAVQNLELLDAGHILENCTTKSMVDGQWVVKTQTFASDISLAQNVYQTFDLSDYLPNDGYNYEVLFTITGSTGATSGNAVEISAKSDIITTDIYRVLGCTTRSSSKVEASSGFLLPVGLGRTVTVRQIHSSTCTLGFFRAVANRRIGTNI